LRSIELELRCLSFSLQPTQDIRIDVSDIDYRRTFTYSGPLEHKPLSYDSVNRRRNSLLTFVWRVCNHPTSRSDILDPWKHYKRD
jgi:hypothetical protein